MSATQVANSALAPASHRRTLNEVLLLAKLLSFLDLTPTLGLATGARGEPLHGATVRERRGAGGGGEARTTAAARGPQRVGVGGPSPRRSLPCRLRCGRALRACRTARRSATRAPDPALGAANTRSHRRPRATVRGATEEDSPCCRAEPRAPRRRADGDGPLLIVAASAPARRPRRASRRLPHRAWRRPATHPAAHVHAPRRRRDAAPGGGGPRGARARFRGASDASGRDVPRGGRPPSASMRATSAWSRTSRSWTGATWSTSCTSPAGVSAWAAAARASPRSPRASTSTRAASCSAAPERRRAGRTALPRGRCWPRRGWPSSSLLDNDAKEEQQALVHHDLLLPWRGLLLTWSAVSARASVDHVPQTKFQADERAQAEIVLLLVLERHRSDLRRRRCAGHLRVLCCYGAQPRLRAVLPGAGVVMLTQNFSVYGADPGGDQLGRPVRCRAPRQGACTDGWAVRPVLQPAATRKSRPAALRAYPAHREQGKRSPASRRSSSVPSTIPWRSRW